MPVRQVCSVEQNQESCASSHPHRRVLPGELLSLFLSSLPRGAAKEEKEEPVHSLVANSDPSQELHITLSYLVKFSETVPCVE